MPRVSVTTALTPPPQASLRTRAKPALKLPKTLAGCADRLYELKGLKSKAAAVVAEMENEEKAIREHLINNLPKSEASGVAGRVARVTIETKTVPTVEDWDAFYAYVAKTKSFDLLQRRLGEGAIKERWDAGKAVPGVGKFKAVTISLNKI